jgi:predicted RND superfamily exporter protein
MAFSGSVYKTEMGHGCGRVMRISWVIGFRESTSQDWDLDPGAPELRPDSRYNRDNKFMTQNYAASSDVLVVMVKTPENQAFCTAPDDNRALEWELQQLPGSSQPPLADLSKQSLG